MGPPSPLGVPLLLSGPPCSSRIPPAPLGVPPCSSRVPLLLGPPSPLGAPLLLSGSPGATGSSTRAGPWGGSHPTPHGNTLPDGDFPGMGSGRTWSPSRGGFCPHFLAFPKFSSRTSAIGPSQSSRGQSWLGPSRPGRAALGTECPCAPGPSLTPGPEAPGLAPDSSRLRGLASDFPGRAVRPALSRGPCPRGALWPDQSLRMAVPTSAAADGVGTSSFSQTWL